MNHNPRELQPNSCNHDLHHRSPPTSSSSNSDIITYTLFHPLRCNFLSDADSEYGANDDGEGLVFVVVVVQERTDVEDVSGAAGEEGETWTKDVVDTAAEDTEDGEDGVEGGVSIVHG
ncbi:hypothetical protein L6452_34346 [Arctium lappa]|uniref:Uncharacterized protein n=1 Tax=Arctium lappa TaxID=4217 RepID=A0ACB8YHX1_ARCLA|nr:hypothetical protein L6452_34346 [Arctium lappa]